MQSSFVPELPIPTGMVWWNDENLTFCFWSIISKNGTFQNGIDDYSVPDWYLTYLFSVSWQQLAALWCDLMCLNYVSIVSLPSTVCVIITQVMARNIWPWAPQSPSLHIHSRPLVHRPIGDGMVWHLMHCPTGMAYLLMYSLIYVVHFIAHFPNPDFAPGSN